MCGGSIFSAVHNRKINAEDSANDSQPIAQDRKLFFHDVSPSGQIFCVWGRVNANVIFGAPESQGSVLDISRSHRWQSAR